VTNQSIAVSRRRIDFTHKILIDESVPRPALAVADAVKIYKLLTERNLDVERDIMMRQKLPVGSWGKPYGHKAFKYEFRVSK
jgi:hypothetical protein